MDAATRAEIISAFGDHLASRKSVFERESGLPFPKELIRQALAEELVTPTMPGLIEAMEGAFISLEDFISDEEYDAGQRYEQVLARGLLLKQSSDSVAASGFAREMIEVSGPWLAVQNRTLLLQEARQQQLLKMRALRQAEKK